MINLLKGGGTTSIAALYGFGIDTDFSREKSCRSEHFKV